MAPAAKKKDAGADAGGPAPMPEGAAADPGSALTVLAQSYGSQLIGVMQGAAGNAETDRELATLQEAKTVAATAKTDR
ncbi:MAG: hypothetical protein JNJ59_08025, partial [Deltaproteobacteria bacterium]|nr:hypothetical protein [Deltaproteobacteria bacterium]